MISRRAPIREPIEGRFGLSVLSAPYSSGALHEQRTKRGVSFFGEPYALSLPS